MIEKASHLAKVYSLVDGFFYKLRKYKISAMTALSQVVILKCLMYIGNAPTNYFAFGGHGLN
ncbi:hypothetical protein PD280_05650 [Virgibacillus salarius]|uniref:hypothetical protein n=1 Tax=Virgibacillus salarius TaxID=447199 RepID=UPI0024914A70|nr:hypothetical protein [Virgibacillus salarius]WBX81217.1 hypothetical protein PD280_05650 [Virgibacillus salarius]